MGELVGVEGRERACGRGEHNDCLILPGLWKLLDHKLSTGLDVVDVLPLAQRLPVRREDGGAGG